MSDDIFERVNKRQIAMEEVTEPASTTDREAAEAFIEKEGSGLKSYTTGIRIFLAGAQHGRQQAAEGVAEVGESELHTILETLKEQWPIAEIKLRFTLLEREKLKEATAELVEALEECENEWCGHPDIRLKNNNDLDRDWCSCCSRWIYRGREESPASAALAKHKARL